MTDYVFEGEIIRITLKDYEKWRRLYPALDLVSELEQLDTELEARQREGGNVKKWFSECVGRLNGRNKRAENSMQRGNGGVYGPRTVNGCRPTRDIPITEQLADRSWADKH